MDFVGVCLAVVVLILILLIYTQLSVEHFDTYDNHYMGAADVYGSTTDQAALWAKYNWKDQDKVGMRVYDYVYEHTIRDGAWRDGPMRNSATYNAISMYQPNPAVVFNGQVIDLSQKNA